MSIKAQIFTSKGVPLIGTKDVKKRKSHFILRQSFTVHIALDFRSVARNSTAFGPSCSGTSRQTTACTASGDFVPTIFPFTVSVTSPTFEKPITVAVELVVDVMRVPTSRSVGVSVQFAR